MQGDISFLSKLFFLSKFKLVIKSFISWLFARKYFEYLLFNWSLIFAMGDTPSKAITSNDFGFINWTIWFIISQVSWYICSYDLFFKRAKILSGFEWDNSWIVEFKSR